MLAVRGNCMDTISLLVDEDIEKILLGTYNHPRSARELSEKLGIPIARCYRKIRILESAGLLKREKTLIDRRGRILYLYRSLLDDAYVFFENGRRRVRFRVAMGIARDFRERWKLLRTGRA